MLLPFFKVVGAGNDCLVAFGEHLSSLGVEPAKIVRSICDRHNGIGADQFFEVHSTAPLAVQVWNCDGSKAEMCANGTRSFLLLAREQAWVDASVKELSVLVSGKAYTASWSSTGYELCLGSPKVEPEAEVTIQERSIPYIPVSVGNPHAVVYVQESGWIEPSDFQFKEWGSLLETHPQFPNRTNVEFIRSIEVQGDHAEVNIEVWERGAGATLSCGTGAVAVAAAISAENKALKRFSVIMNGNVLNVRLEGGKAFLSGPSRTIAKGTYLWPKA